MNRETLAEWIAHPVYSPRVKRHGVSMEDALRFVDEYTHELAEEIRNKAREEGGSYEWTGGTDFAADLIDPPPPSAE